MQAEFRAPRRRTRVYEDYEAPLPVSQDPQERKVYRADLINQQVVVCHPDHIQEIHNKGFFGKGVLSRARPDHGISDKWEQHEGLVLPVFSQSRYEELLRWATATLSAQGLDEEAVSQTLLSLTQPVKMEDVRREAGPVGGASGHTKRLRAESEVKPEAKRSCRLDQNDLDSGSEPDSDSGPDSCPDPGSDSDPDPGLQVPGPGYVLVVSDCPKGGGVRQVRRSPLLLSEYLQLSLEEAFFLVYSLGVLSVYLQQEPLSIIQLWRKLQSLRPDFVCTYAAYHHFRSMGWVPKGGGGAKYGVDFMLYRRGPPFYHASYSVVVERTDETFRGAAMRPFSWRSLAALSRITANVSKELMMCYIICPADLSGAELDSPVCLSRLKVQEVIISRWVSSRERAEQDDS
ncbi:tRNA-splicing endonuclease subunit Sen2 [Kryptolebias marmoratus]|uniref:tRNA-splicing endonuclease subunit Sen2 n=1 Tax=Kryptolebias marmoratus TaxID=37003 RepID=UPI0018AC9C1F|nr:tRNA-splicing endonuclease subunit Sen2 [Kryptolebias marmoratus]XP_024859186.2 tRNA-splicing endonuclease subunit Sen2 [Kryptolebias marmoratus]XP_024859187.2 tRNA-splicing endonuclease subunit Sen2 [Kryptolebias marmoratus]